MKNILEIVFKYVVNGKQIVVKRNEENVITGYSFRSIKYDELMQDPELLELIASNQESGEFNIRHGKKGNSWVDRDKLNKLFFCSVELGFIPDSTSSLVFFIYNHTH